MMVYEFKVMLMVGAKGMSLTLPLNIFMVGGAAPSDITI